MVNSIGVIPAVRRDLHGRMTDETLTNWAGEWGRGRTGVCRVGLHGRIPSVRLFDIGALI